MTDMFITLIALMVLWVYISKLIKLHTVNTGSFSVCQLYINYLKIPKNVIQRKSREIGILDWRRHPVAKEILRKSK